MGVSFQSDGFRYANTLDSEARPLAGLIPDTNFSRRAAEGMKRDTEKLREKALRVREDKLAMKALDVLLECPIRGIGGGVMNAKGDFLMDTTDLYHAVRRLGNVGVVVERTDSGGRPTWEIISIK